MTPRCALGVESPWILWLRWLPATALPFLVVGLLVACAPVDPRPLRWITFGSALVVAAWLGASLVLAWYLTSIADYGSIFDALATVVVVLNFLTGAQLDAILRERFGADRREPR